MAPELTPYGLTKLALNEVGAWHIEAGEVTMSGDDLTCELTPLHEGAAAYLQSLLDRDEGGLEER